MTRVAIGDPDRVGKRPPVSFAIDVGWAYQPDRRARSRNCFARAGQFRLARPFGTVSAMTGTVGRETKRTKSIRSLGGHP